MPSPSTPILDTFVGAGGTALSSSEWTVLRALRWTAGPRIGGSNDLIAASGGATGAALWTREAFGADQEAHLRIVSASGYFGLFMRMNGAIPRPSGYAITFGVADGFKFYRWDDGVPTQMGTTLPLTWAAGDQWLFQAIGHDISVYRKPAAGSWPSTPTAAVSDRSHSGAGYVGIVTEGSDSALDDLGGGSLAIDAAYAVAGPAPRAADGRLLVESATPATVVRGLPLTAAGNVAVSTGAPAALPWHRFAIAAGGALSIVLDADGTWRDGFLRDATGALCVTETGPFAWHGGFLRDAIGRLAVDVV